jgi:hypothetical protein
MNRAMEKRLSALEARLLKPAIVRKLSIEGFDMDEYQPLLHELTTQDGWFDNWQLSLREWVREQQGRQKVLIFDKGYFYESD